MSPDPRPVPILRIPFSDDDRGFIHTELDGVLDGGILSMGSRTKAFEEGFASLVGTDHCVATSNGTSALELILRALGIRDKSVVVPTNTFFATALAVINSGNRVVFADSDPTTMCLDPADLSKRIRDDTAAVILVHIGGVVTPALAEIESLCDLSGLSLIEDCAHAHGSEVQARAAGSFGVAGAFSFFPTKVLTTGEGGAITTDDTELYGRAMVLRNQGKVPALDNRIGELGNNYRMSEITAVLGLEQIRKAPRVIEERRRIATMYDELLADVAGIEPITLSEGTESGYYKYIAFLDDGIDRAALKQRMREGFQVSLTGEVYADLCHTEPVWERYGYCGRRRPTEGAPCPGEPDCGCSIPQESFPGAEQLAGSHVCLPLYPGLTEEDVVYVVESLGTVLGERGATE